MEPDQATMLRCIAILCTIELQSVQPVGQPTTEIGWLLFRPTGRTEKCTFVLQVGRLDVLSINTTWENLQIEKHKSGRRPAHRTDLGFSICRFSQVVFIPQAQPHAQSLFLFPIVFGINFFSVRLSTYPKHAKLVYCIIFSRRRRLTVLDHYEAHDGGRSGNNLMVWMESNSSSNGHWKRALLFKLFTTAQYWISYEE